MGSKSTIHPGGEETRFHRAQGRERGYILTSWHRGISCWTGRPPLPNECLPSHVRVLAEAWGLARMLPSGLGLDLRRAHIRLFFFCSLAASLRDWCWSDRSRRKRRSAVHRHSSSGQRGSTVPYGLGYNFLARSKRRLQNFTETLHRYLG